MVPDPLTKILDIGSDLKDEATDKLTYLYNNVQDLDAVQSVKDFIFGQRGPVSQISSSFATRPPPPPPSYWSSCQSWVLKNKLLTAFAVVGSGAAFSTWYYYYLYLPSISRGSFRPRRRAERAANGARKQVVLIAGSPAEPLAKNIAVDLDKRGFIVYWTAASPDEQAIVESFKSADIRVLAIRPTEVSSIRESMAKLSNVLHTPCVAFDGAEAHYLSLVGVIVIPDMFYPTGPVESIREDAWTDVLYSKILGPIFLLSNGLLDLVRDHKSRVLLLSPSIMGSLNPGFHSAESVAANALSSLALCLSRELKPQHVPFLYLKLGSFEMGHEKINKIYAQNYKASAHLQTSQSSGSRLKVLHHAVFDALTTRNPRRVWHVGRGSYIYEWIARYVPEFLLGWLMQPTAIREAGWETI